ncbi:MAG: GNAT family N-acetyltransferase [Oscillospiraceae bacterium]|jgi:RimJ/RimL family protein N-acetyltransferase|nr:GNAT family N-acetyltransferase [Oscillospiraceae bacterium]
MRYFPKLVGERIYLSPKNLDDAEIFTKWINDPEVSAYLGLHGSLLSLPAEHELLERHAKSDDSRYEFCIVEKDGDRLLGSIGLHCIKRNYRSCELELFIGEAADRSQGYGAEAIRLLLRYAFRTLNMHCVLLHVNSTNARAIRCYEKCGFQQCGRQREAIFMNGSYADKISMDILESEFDA